VKLRGLSVQARRLHYEYHAGKKILKISKILANQRADKPSIYANTLREMLFFATSPTDFATRNSL